MEGAIEVVRAPRGELEPFPRTGDERNTDPGRGEAGKHQAEPGARRRVHLQLQIRRPLGRRRLLSAVFSTAMITAALCVSINPAIATISSGRSLGADFKGDLYTAGRAILDGRNPYNEPLLDREAAAVRAGRTPVTIASPRWPPPVLIGVVPLSLLGFAWAAAVFAVLSATSLIVALRLLGVRDWRCLVIACVSWPAVMNLWWGNISSFLLLGAALAWRCRSGLWRLATATAAIVAVKLFAWPLAAWLLFTRRLQAFGLTVMIGGLAVVGAWALIRFASALGYPHILSDVAYIGESKGSSLVTTLMAAGATTSLARALALAAAGAILGVACRLTRYADGDRRAFGLVTMAALTATPVVWPHYLVLLFLPVALLSPCFSPAWLLPLLAGIAPWPVSNPSVWTNMPDLAIELTVIAWLCSPLIRDHAAPVARLVCRNPRSESAQPGSMPVTALENG